jgi:hypothetical protein
MGKSIVVFRNGKKRQAGVYQAKTEMLAELFEAAHRGDPTARNNPDIMRAHLQWTQYKANLLSGRAMPNPQLVSQMNEIMSATDSNRAIELYGALRRTIDANSLGYGGIPVLTDVSVRYADPMLVMNEVYKPLYRLMPNGTYNIYADNTEKPYQPLNMGPAGDVRTVHSAAPGVGIYDCTPFGAETRVAMAELLAANYPPVRYWINETEEVDNELAFNDEVNACTFQATSGNYASGNFIVKGGGSRWTDAGIDPQEDIINLDLKVRNSRSPTMKLHVMVRPVWDILRTHPLLLARLASTSVKVINEEQYFALFPDCDGIVVSDAVRSFSGTRRYVMSNLFQIVQVPTADSSTAEIAVHGMQFRWQPAGSESTRGMYVAQWMESGEGERGIMKHKKTYRASVNKLADKAAAAYSTPIDPALMTPPS